jgi:hypothetical protein
MKPEDFSQQAEKVQPKQSPQPESDSFQIIRNFDDPFDGISSRPKETRDIRWDRNSENFTDPRFKSPDEFLNKKAPKKISISQPAKIRKPEPIIAGIPELSEIRKELEAERRHFREGKEVTVSEIVSAPAPQETPAPTSQDGDDKNLAKWIEYAQQVKAWQKLVLGIVQSLKTELKKTENFKAEITELKEQLQLKEQEISELRQQGKNKFLSWFKAKAPHHRSVERGQ